MATVGAHQQSSFTEPFNTQSPIDADQVRANDNALRGVYNSHDADPTIHVQSSTLASRPGFGTVGQTWLVTDQMKLYYDTGLAWAPLKMDAANIDTGTIASARLSGAYTGITGLGTLTSLAVSGSATIGTGLTVTTGGVTVTGNSTITGTLGGITTLTATTLAGQLSTAAQPNVTSVGTLTGLTVSGNASVSGTITLNGQAYTFPASQTANRFLKTDGSGTLTWAVAGEVFGSGTSGRVTRWTAANTIGDSIIRDDGTNVGINTAPNASYRLDVSGNVRASGTLTLNGLTYTFPAAQTPNYFLKTDGSGNLSWVPGSSSAYGRIVTNFTATAGQTSFTVTYTPGYVDVYLNGIRLLDGTDYTATNGTSVVLTTGAALNDEVAVIALDVAAAAGSITGSGTTGKLLKFNSLTTAGDSIMSESGAEIDVAGNVDLASSYTYKINGTSVLSATALGSGVTSSSLTSVGTLSSLTVSGNLNVDSGTLQVDSANDRVGVGGAPSHKLDVAGNVNVGSGNTYKINGTDVLSATALGAGVTSSSLTSLGTLSSLSVSGTVTFSTPLPDSALATISTAGKIANSATTATDANLGASIVLRDGAGNFTASAITASLIGNASTATKLQAARTINGVSFDGSSNITVTADAFTLTGTNLNTTVTGSSLTSVGTLTSLAVSGNVESPITINRATTTTGAAFVKFTNAGGDCYIGPNDSLGGSQLASTAGTSDYALTLVTNSLRPILFAVDEIERGRFTTTGYFKAADGATYDNLNGTYHELRQSTTDSVLVISASNSSFVGNGMLMKITRAANSAFDFIECGANTVAQFRVRGDGVIYAQNTTVQSISDGRLKENVTDATDGLNIITALRPVRFDWKAGYGNDRKHQLGFIAQEVEAVFSEAVDVWEMDEPTGAEDENGEPITEKVDYKTVGPGALIPVLVKAIQELEARIAVLEAK